MDIINQQDKQHNAVVSLLEAAKQFHTQVGSLPLDIGDEEARLKNIVDAQALGEDLQRQLETAGQQNRAYLQSLTGALTEALTPTPTPTPVLTPAQAQTQSLAESLSIALTATFLMSVATSLAQYNHSLALARVQDLAQSVQSQALAQVQDELPISPNQPGAGSDDEVANATHVLPE